MYSHQKAYNMSERNCTQVPKEIKIPQVTPSDCHLIDTLVSQIFADLYYILSSVGIVANLIKLILTIKAYHDWTTAHLYMVNLSISHILFLLSCPLWGFYLNKQYDWQLEQYLCTATNFISILGHCGSTLFLCIISIERTATIYFPVASIHCKKKLFGIVFSLAAWLVSSLLASVGLVYTTFLTSNTSKHFCIVMQVTTLSHPISIRTLILFTFSHVVLPVILVLPSYAKMVAYVVQRLSRKTRLPMQTERDLHADLVMITLFLICCFTTSCYLLMGCVLYITSQGCHDECWWTNAINISLECSKLLNIISASACPWIYFAPSIKTRCKALGKCTGTPIEEAPALQLVYSSCAKDDNEIGPYFATS